jgi:hypothetical protein
MPGYPLFLGVLIKIFGSQISIFAIQYILLLFTYYLSYKILNNIISTDLQKRASLIFLLISILSIQLPYYAGQIAPQSLTIFFIVLFFYIITLKVKSSLKIGVVNGFIFSVLFQLMPSILILPILIFSIAIFYRKSISSYLISLSIFALSLLPFGFWNLSNHGVFKITPLEGGAGVAHMGYWQYKLPKNYLEKFYWGNNTGDDIIYPFRESEELTISNLVKFESEWRDIKSLIENKNIELDISKKEKMEINNLGQFVLGNSSYVIEREKLLWNYTISNIIEDPVYYCKTRFYAFLRSYFSGVSESALINANSLKQKLNIIYPFLVTFTLVFLGIVFIFYNMINKWRLLSFELKIMFITIIYFGLIHTPFATQARYTIPVHMLVFLLVSFFISPHLKWLSNLINRFR